MDFDDNYQRMSDFNMYHTQTPSGHSYKNSYNTL